MGSASILCSCPLNFLHLQTHTCPPSAYSTPHDPSPPCQAPSTTSSYSNALMPTVTFRGLMKQKVRPLNGPVSRITSQTNSPATKASIVPHQALELAVGVTAHLTRLDSATTLPELPQHLSCLLCLMYRRSIKRERKYGHATKNKSK